MFRSWVFPALVGLLGAASSALGAAPANDTFAARAPLAGHSARTGASTTGATKEPGEPSHASNAGGASLWWTWTAPLSGTVTVLTEGSDFDTLLAVYTGTSVGALTRLAANNNSALGGTTSRLAFSATAGTTYQIAVDGAGGATGQAWLTLLGPAPNDAFANALVLTGTSAASASHNTTATAEPLDSPWFWDDGSRILTSGRTLWWRWTAPADGAIAVDTTGCPFDNLLALHSGTTTPVPKVAAVGSPAELRVTAGASYYLMVDGISGGSGYIPVHLEFFTTPQFATQPAASVSVETGDSALLTCTLTDPRYTIFQWQVSIDFGETWFDLADTSTYGGETAAELTIFAVTEDFDGLRYRCIATNTAGEATSAAATLVVTPGGEKGVIEAAGGSQHSVFLRANGDLWKMGYREPYAPVDKVPVPVASGGVTLGAGGDFTYLLKADGSLWTAGRNGTGQLGNGTTSTAMQIEPARIRGDVIAVATGANHGLFLTRDGTLWACGHNANGQLGDGTTTNRPTPAAIATDVVAIAAGMEHSFYATRDGTLWAMGSGNAGQLGDGTSTDRLTPVAVATGVVQMAAGFQHSLFITADGRLWAMGSHGFNLGDGMFGSSPTPAVVAENVTACAAGQSFSLYLTSDGVLHGCGSNSRGQLGDGTTETRTTPVVIASDVTHMDAGLEHSLFVRTDGSLWACGANGSGMLGDGTTTDRLTPVRIVAQGLLRAPTAPALLGVAPTADGFSLRLAWVPARAADRYEVWRGPSTSFAAATRIADDVRWTVFHDVPPVAGVTYHYWVRAVNTSGTGPAAGPVGAALPGRAPAFARAPADQTVERGVAVSFSVVALGVPLPTLRWQVSSDAGATWTNLTEDATHAGTTTAQLTLAAATPELRGTRYRCVATNPSGTTPSASARLELLPGIIATAAGQGHTLWLRADGTLWATGGNGEGQLGDGTTDWRSSPVAVASGVSAVATAANHTLFLKTDGSLWACGNNTYGQLGDGSTTSRSSPVPAATGVSAIATAAEHSLFLKLDGTLWAMGNNSSGRLGDGTTTSRSTPVQVATGVVAMAAGHTHSLILKSDGALWTTTSSGGLQALATDVVAATAGQGFSLFVKADGSLWGTGANWMGQLGDGSTTERPSPVQLAAGVACAAAGTWHGASIKSDGSLWTTGYNDSGQLGDGSATNRTTRVQVASAAWAASPGTNHTLFLQPDGSLWATGNNGTWPATTTPVKLQPAGWLPVPAAPAGLELAPAADGTRLHLTWTRPPLATRYEVWRGTTADFASATLLAGDVLGWWWDDVPPLAATTYHYWVRAIGPGGTSPASPAASASLPPLVPSFTLAPADQAVVIGAGVSFTVAVSGVPAPSLRWQTSAGGGLWTNLADDASTSGTTTATLQLAAMSPALHGQLYRCVATNSAGTTTSAAARLTLPPAIVALAAGGEHTLWLRSDGTLWAMGNGNSGQLGTGLYDSRVAPVLLATDVITAAAGSNHTLWVTSDGTLWGCGQNSDGQLGDGSTTARNTPITIATGVVRVAAGGRHSLFVKTDGSLWACGLNNTSQLGDGSATIRLSPVPVASGVATVAASEWHSAFVKTDGTLWTMGYNASGQLGDGSSGNTRTSPVRVTGGVATVSVGESHTLFRKTDGSLWAAGSAFDGQLGTGSFAGVTSPVQLVTSVAQVSAGRLHSLWVLDDGTLRATGNNGSGQLGDGTTTTRTSPETTATGVRLAAAGANHSVWLTTDGALWATGSNGYGQFGDGTWTSTSTPVEVSPATALPPPFAPVSLAVAPTAGATALRLTWPLVPGATHYEVWRGTGATLAGAALLAGTVAGAPFDDVPPVPGASYTYWVRAMNASGPGRYSPAATGALAARAPAFTTQPADVTVAAGVGASFTVAATGVPTPTLRWQRSTDAGTSWANLADNATYAGTTTPTLTIAAVSLALHDTRYRCVATNTSGSTPSASARLSLPPAVVAAAAGGNHSLYLRADGSLWGMGAGGNGQLGPNASTSTANLTPVLVATDVVRVAAGHVHTLLLSRDGSLRAMGENSSGQLGDGTTTRRTTPVVIAAHVVALATSGNHSFFVTADGTAWATGDNTFGALGDGTDAHRSTPAAVATGVVAVSTSGTHTLFVKADGSLWATGYNYWGQLGDGTTTSRTAPVLVATGVRAAAAGDYHSLFLKTDGTLWACGRNYYGTFADGTTAASGTAHPWPRQVATGIRSVVTTGGSHSLFIAADGTLFAAGYNASGQLGTGNTTDIATATAVATGVLSAAGSSSNTFHLHTDGSLWATGGNWAGQLGDGTTTNRLTAVEIVAPGPLLTPAAPLTLNATARADGAALQLRWPHATAATRYEVWRATSDTFAAATLVGATTDWPGWDDVPPAAGTTFFYWVRAANTAGTSPASPSASGALAALAPAFTTQPANQIAAVGAGASFSVAVTGVPAPTLRWQTSTNGGATWVNLADDATHTGTTTGTLTVAAMTEGLHGRRYRCTATSSAGSATSDPARLILPPGVVQASAASSHSLFLKADGTLWATGANGSHQGGPGATTTRTTPVTWDAGVVACAAGQLFSLSLHADGTLWAIGHNGSGQLGDGTLNNRSTPLQVATDVVAVAAGDAHSLFLKRDGSLWGMGQNAYGQLGDGSNVDRPTPLLIARDVARFAAGAYTSFFVKADGTLWGMGNNGARQLGDGTTSWRYSPVQVATGVDRVAAGDWHTLVLKTDGALWGMGSNGAPGQLGAGTGTLFTPTALVGSGGVPIAGVRHISAGANHSLSVDIDGSAWAFGSNSVGQLGDGTGSTSRSTPFLIGEAVHALAAGDYHSLIVHGDGSLRACGRNDNGQLGDGTTINRSTPVVIAAGRLDAPEAAPAAMQAEALADLGAIRVSGFGAIGAGAYEVWRGTTASFAGATRIAANLPAPLHYDTTATPGAVYRYWLRATNGAGASPASAPVTASLPGTTTGLAAWRLAHFGTTEDIGPAANAADPDADGLSNLLECAFGTDPLRPSVAPLAPVLADGHLVLAVTKSPNASGLTFGAEASTDLVTWSAATVTVLEDTPTSYRVRENLPSSAPRRFLRLVLTPVE